MKKILVPTDFSENAGNALNYAIELAKKENAEIILLHVYHPTLVAPYLDVMPDVDAIMEEERWLNKLRSLQTKIEHAGEIESSIVARLDLAVDGIVSEAEDRNVDLIVMGTRGVNGLKEIFLGSNTARVAERAHCPVIAVPEGASYQHLKKIAYACNYRQIDIEAIQKLVEMARPLNAQVNILHVYNPDSTHAKEEMERFIREAEKQLIYENLSYELIEGEDIEERLEQYLETEAADLLVLSTHERNLRDKLFGNSITQKLVYHSKVPVMAFHYKKEEAVPIV